VLATPGGSRHHPAELALQAVDDSRQVTCVDEFVICLAIKNSDRLLEGLHLDRHADILQTFVRQIQRCTVSLP
jgi:hypothetical protein